MSNMTDRIDTIEGMPGNEVRGKFGVIVVQMPTAWAEAAENHR